jgi:streptogramin lyase
MLTGTGLAAASFTLVAASGSATDFGTVRIGSSQVETFVLTNTGGQTSSAINLSITGTDYSQVSPGTGDCVSGVTTLTGGSKCNIKVQLAPTGQAGVRNGSVGASAVTGGSAPTLTLNGYARLPAGMFIYDYAIPAGDNVITSLAAGSDGEIWFLEDFPGRMTLLGGYEYPIVSNTNTSQYSNLIPGPDNNLWFGGEDNQSINKVGTNRVLTPYLPTLVGHLDFVGAGPDGNIWFTTQPDGSIPGSIGALGKMTTAGVVLNQYALNPNTTVGGWIVSGSDGNVWFTEIGRNKIAKSTTSGVITEYTIPTANGLGKIALGPDNNIWMAESNANKIAKITPSGTVTEFTLSSSPTVQGPYGIVGGSDGNVWFTENTTGKIARITSTGTVTEFMIPAPAGGLPASPTEIILGPDSNIWFVENSPNHIVCITP